MSYTMLGAGYGDWPIIKQIATILGILMDGIFNVLSSIGIQNIGVCIIVFTVIIYTLMIPLTIKQQKWSKMSAVMQPEIRKIQKKYQGKRDQASMMQQQQEMQIIYEKYGASPTGGCLPMMIQLPILFALYPVIYNIPKYVSAVRKVYEPIANHILSSENAISVMEKLGAAKPILMNPKSYDYHKMDTLITALYKFQNTSWEALTDKVPDVATQASDTVSQISHMNMFLGINIGEMPINMLMDAIKPFNIVGIIMAVIIPVMAGLTQFLSVKLAPQPQGADADNPMANSMKTMIYVMPVMSVFFGFSLPAGMGLYWAISALVRSIQQIAINKYLSKKSVEEMIEENQKKAAKKREKKGVPASEINRVAVQRTKNTNDNYKKMELDETKKDKLEKARTYAASAKPGSLAEKANMVSRYNDQKKNNK